MYVFKRATLCLLVSCVLCHFAYASELKSKEPINIVTNNWTSQIVLSHVVGSVFESMGYQVAYLSISTSDQWGALSNGFAHVQVEVWEGTMADMFKRMVEEGGMVDMGDHFAKTREEWWYPEYVESLCPGLPDWEALKACAGVFSTPYSAPLGTYYSGPWEKPDAARVRALGMDFRVKVLADGDALWEVLGEAMAQQKPIVLFNWTPNWVELKYPGKFVEFPAYAPECETDPEWGINPEFTYDCGNPKGGWLKKAAWSGMAETWPCAARTLQKIRFTNKQIADASLLVDINGMSPEEAAVVWLQQHPEISQTWIAEGCR